MVASANGQRDLRELTVTGVLAQRLQEGGGLVIQHCPDMGAAPKDSQHGDRPGGVQG